MRDHRNLQAFEKAHSLATLMYQVTPDFPEEERYGLTAQIRRAAVSIPSNIVEGAARNSLGDYVRFLDIAYASAKEMQYQWLLARDLEMVSKDRWAFVEEHIEAAVVTLARLLKKLRAM